MRIITLQYPSFAIYWSLYWYLGALFVCLLVIKILADFFRIFFCLYYFCSDTNCIPMISFERSCYMILFLWIGYFLHLYINHIGVCWIFSFILIFYVSFFFWNIRYSIYVTPFHVWNVNGHSVIALFRLIIGAVGGTVVILVSKILIIRPACRWMS